MSEKKKILLVEDDYDLCEEMKQFFAEDNQLSLAIGNKGQNALLAAKLTNCKIDIKAESKVTPEDLIVTEYVPEEPAEEAPAEEAAAVGSSAEE